MPNDNEPKLPSMRLPTHEEFCLGIWWSHQMSGQTPPPVKHIAAMVGCDRKYAYRILGPLENMRKEAAKVG